MTYIYLKSANVSLYNLLRYYKVLLLLGAFGTNTTKAAEEAGLTLNIKAPVPQAPSMVSALDKFLAEANKILKLIEISPSLIESDNKTILKLVLVS